VFETDPQFWLTHGYAREDWRKASTTQDRVRVTEEDAGPVENEQYLKVQREMSSPQRLADLRRLILELGERNAPEQLLLAPDQTAEGMRRQAAEQVAREQEQYRRALAGDDANETLAWLKAHASALQDLLNRDREH